MKIRLLIGLLLTGSALWAQSLSAPIAEGVYGGQVGDFESWAFSSDSIYVVCSTQSPNSLFYAKANRNGQITNLDWQVIPSADADDGFGASIMNVEIHEASNSIYFLSQGKVYRTSFGATVASQVDSMVKEFIIQGDTMALVKNNPMAGGLDVLDFGPINSSGIYSKAGSKTLMKNYTEPPQLVIHPINQYLYIFEAGSSPTLFFLSSAFHSLSSSTSLVSTGSVGPSITNIEWRTFGFDHLGSWYLAGQPPLANPTIRDRHLAWSTDMGFNWYDAPINTPGPVGGVVGSNILVTDYSGQQSLYIGNAVEQDISSIGTWINPGQAYIENLNRANDGFTKQDPLNPAVVYHSTNIGFGYSTERGDSIFGWNEGLTAVQVNDIDMTTDFATGWVASKSGIRKVENYNTSSPTWSGPSFPNFDGAPYTAIAMSASQPDTIYAGNQRIYRSQNGGQQISPSNDGWSRVFSPEDPPLNYNRINTHCTAIAVAPDSADIVMAGFSIDFGDKGGCFYSLDGGNNWQQLLILASSPGQDADITDIVISREAGNLVAYIGLSADPLTAGHNGVYRAELGSSGFSLSADGSFGATDHTVDLELNNSGDSLFVLNRDPGLLPVNNVFIKDLASGAWSNFAGPSASGEATAITDGDGYVFIAMDESIYINSTDGSLGWSLGYAYPVGTEINVLFYDELLVGTGTGLYAHDLIPDISISELEKAQPFYIYPNPSYGVVRWDKAMNLEVFNLQGQRIYRSIQAIQEMNCKNWPQGIYLFKFENGAEAKVLIQP